MLYFITIFILLVVITCYDILYIVRPYDVVWSYERFLQISKKLKNVPALFYHVT